MIPIKVPPLGESIVEATVAGWRKEEGDAVSQGETLVELETDKITVEVPAFKAGVLTRQLKKDGDVVTVDEILGELDETGGQAGQQAGAQAAEESQEAPARATVAAEGAQAVGVTAQGAVGATASAAGLSST